MLSMHIMESWEIYVNTQEQGGETKRGRTNYTWCHSNDVYYIIDNTKKSQGNAIKILRSTEFLGFRIPNNFLTSLSLSFSLSLYMYFQISHMKIQNL